MLVMQADSWDPALRVSGDTIGFGDTLETLQLRTIQFAKPVVLVTGDRHYFSIDKPSRHSAPRCEARNP